MADRGVPLTPEELEQLAEMYGECGNASAVAAEMGVAVSTVTRNLARLGEQKRAKLQRSALTRGLCTAREHLETVADELGQQLITQLRAGGASAIEPRDTQALTNALARASAVLALFDAREERRQQARLTRARTRAEIVAIETRTREVPPMDVLRAKLSPEQIVELVSGLTNEQLAAATATATQAAEVPPAKG